MTNLKGFTFLFLAATATTTFPAETHCPGNVEVYL